MKLLSTPTRYQVRPAGALQMPTSKTKELAAKLGLLPCKRKLAEGESSANAKKRKTGQLLSYVVVIDFESTCWENKKGLQEIIEFPAVLLNLQTGDIDSEFQQYVLPEEFPRLSEFCKQLTGITQDQVNGGVPLKTCLYLFNQWVENIKKERQLLIMEPGQEYTKDMTLCAFVTWTDWDFGVCLNYECRRKQIRKRTYFNQWIDVRALYKTFYDRRPSGLNGALEDLGITFAGRQHSGIDDARNTAKLSYRMVKDGCKLNITKCIQPKVHTSVIKPPCGVTVPKCESSTSTCILDHSAVRSTEISASEANRTNILSHTVTETTAIKDPQPSKACSSVASLQTGSVSEVSLEDDVEEWGGVADEEYMRDIAKELDILENRAISGTTVLQYTKSSVKDSTHTVVDQQSNHTTTTALIGPNQTPSRTQNINHVAPVTLLPSGRGNPPLKQVFKNATATSAPCKRSPFSAPLSPLEFHEKVSPTLKTTIRETPPLELKRLSPATTTGTSNTPNSELSRTTDHVFRTPNTSEWIRTKALKSKSFNSLMYTPDNSSLDKVVVVNGGKVTPPLCGCGRRAKRKTVCNPGPNEGKPFYVCPSTSGCSSKQGCGFFKWENYLHGTSTYTSSTDSKCMQSEYFE